MHVFRRITKPLIICRVLWAYEASTNLWVEGQVEIRTLENEGNFENWRFFIMIADIGNFIFIFIEYKKMII